MGGFAKARLIGALTLAAAGGASVAQTGGISLSQVFHDFLVGHLAAFRDDAPDAQYQSARYDLNGDGQLEVLVYLEDPIWCGPHGCDLFIFTPDARQRWRRVAEISVGSPPVRVLERRTRGWRELTMYVRSSLMPGEQRRLVYDGSSYVLSPRPLTRSEFGRELIRADARSTGLFKPWPVRYR